MWNDDAKKPIWTFLALTFIIAWASDAVLIIVERTGILSGMAGFIIVTMYHGITSACAPAYAVFILLKKHKQIKGVKDFFFRIFITENLSKIVIITAAFVVFQFIIAMISGQYMGDTWYFALLALPMLLAGIIGGGMEEPGWRGFLQPALEQKFPFVVATLILGVIWAIWHIPAWFIQSIGQSSLNFLSFTLHCITLSFVMAALYKLTKNVFACVLFHSWTNALGIVFSNDILINPPGFKLIAIFAPQILAAIVICFIIENKFAKRANIYNHSRGND